MNDIKFDASLVISAIPQIGIRMRGRIYGDKAGRFADGIEVFTSTVQEIGEGWFRTRNTVYKIIETEPSLELISVNSEYVQRIPTTHEIARTMLAAKDVPLYAMRYEGDLDGEYTSMLTRISCIDYGFVKGVAVVVQEEQEIDIAELEDQLHQEQQDVALVGLLQLSQNDVKHGRVYPISDVLERLHDKHGR